MGVLRTMGSALGLGLVGALGCVGLLACGTGEPERDDDEPPPFVGVGTLGAPEAPGTPGGNGPGAAPGDNASPAPSGSSGGETQPIGGLAPAPSVDGSAAPTAPPQQSPAQPTEPAPEQPAPTEPGAEPTPSAPLPASASEGCGQLQGIPAAPNVANTLLTFPPGYDGSTPVPLLFAFHGAGRTNTDMRMVDSRTVGSQLENNYVVAFMKSAGNAWDLGTDYPRFQAALSQILAEHCIDTDAIFAMGHSSGAQFIVQMLGDQRARETRFAAVAPVASSLYNNPPWSPVPTLLLHGERDTQRPGDLDGSRDISQYVRSNQCQSTTQPVAVPSCSSLAGGVTVEPGCVQYDGCAAPTLFCRHDDPNYLDNGNPTNHGWPCFANNQIFAFLESNR